MRPNLGRLSTFESLWEAWCDLVRVLIRVLQFGPARSLQGDRASLPYAAAQLPQRLDVRPSDVPQASCRAATAKKRNRFTRPWGCAIG
jgi:hypothetical protein